MAKSISLITSFSLPGLGNGECTLPDGIHTIGQLVAHLGGLMEWDFLSPKRDDLDDDVEVFLNGRGLWSFQSGLDTPLRDGDEVDVFVLTLCTG